ncbi:ATP-binding protein [Herbiconiux liangxiaofengii]|uniref:ATP-binding protein n=1 Tax=Herbiconiux liangxiaofengii TaxID=3342795 RepID=UPI0035B90C4D
MPDVLSGAAAASRNRPALGSGERSARRILMVDSALLLAIVVVVHLAFVAQGGLGPYPLWALSLGWVAVTVTLVAVVLIRRLSDRALRGFAIAAVAAYGLTIVTFPAAVPAEGIDRIPWTLSASGAAAAAALVAGGRPLAWITVAVGAAAGLGFRLIYGGLDLDGVVNDLQALLTGAVICVIGGHILTVGRALDVAAADSAEAAAREAAERGRLAARTKAAALVHDEVLATLTLAASELPIPPDRLAAQAETATAMVTRLSSDGADGPPVLRVALAELARQHDAAFEVQGDSTGDVVPAATHDAMLGAAKQALRNSLQHAPDAVRRVLLEQSAGHSRVEIADDGPGFDPEAIGDDRLGVRQSILARLARVPGGAAEVRSRPGAGTRVILEYREPPVDAGDELAVRVSLRRGLAAIAAVYLLTQGVSAVLGSVAEPGSWALQAAVLVTALLAAEVLRRSPGLVPSTRRTAAVLVLCCGGFLAGVAVHAAAGLPFRYGSLWFAVAFAFVLVAVALRRRIRAAAFGAAVIVGVLIVAGLLAGAPAGQIVQLSARPVVLVGLAVALLVVIERMQRRIALLHREAVASAGHRSWTAAARAELAVRLGELARTAFPLLARIGRGRPATEEERREYARSEGELRDGLRAGVLAREPLSSAAAAARERGVDVLLLDDSGGSLDDREADHIVAWLAEGIRGAHERAVGRLLPAGRDARASLTVDGRHSTVGLPQSTVEAPLLTDR